MRPAAVVRRRPSGSRARRAGLCLCPEPSRILAASLALSPLACDSTTGPEPSFPCLDAPLSVSDPHDGTERGLWAQWALELPGGFAGLYLGRPGEPEAPGYVTFLLARPDEAGVAIPLLSEQVSDFYEGADWLEGEIEVGPVEYDYAQLYACAYQLQTRVVIPGFRTFGVDISANRIAIGVGDLSAEGYIRMQMRVARIPQRIVVITEGGGGIALRSTDRR